MQVSVAVADQTSACWFPPVSLRRVPMKSSYSIPTSAIPILFYLSSSGNRSAEVNVPNTKTDASSRSVADMSDAMFCLYRMNVLMTSHNPDLAAIAAIASRMKRLAGTFPDAGLPHREISGYTVGRDPNNTVSDNCRPSG
jgi:hypothetical protein